MSGALVIQNRQRTVRVDLPRLRCLTRSLLEDELQLTEFDLAIFLVAEREMTRINETYLQHAGSTDVITFDYTETVSGRGASAVRSRRAAVCPRGEIFICMDEALVQAKRFRTRWPGEVVRYVIHSVLHLLGFDDSRAADRRKMKREENRLLKRIGRRFPLSKLARTSKVAA